MNPEERRLIAYAAAAHGLVHVMELTYPALLTRIQGEFGVRDVVTGAIAGVFGWAFGSSAIPAGLLTDRLGSRRVIIYAFASAALMSVVVGLSPNAWVLAAGLFGLGLSIGLYHPAGLSLMAQGVRQRGMAIGLHGVAGNSGQALAPALAVGLAVLVDWRLAFFVLAGLAVIMAIAMAATRLNIHAGGEVIHVDVGDEAGDSALAADSSEPAGGRKERNPLLVPLLIVYAGFILGGTVYRGAITYLPKHLEEFVDKDFGGAFLTVALLMGALGQFVGGSLSQRFPLERILPVIAILALPALVLTGLVSGPALVLVSAAFIFFYFANQPVFTGLIADYAPPGAVGRSYGVSFFAGFGIGGTGGPIAGLFVDTWDTRAAFLGLTGFLAVSCVLTLVLWAMAERRRRGAAAAETLAKA